MDIYLPFPKYVFVDCFDECISTQCKNKQALNVMLSTKFTQHRSFFIHFK